MDEPSDSRSQRTANQLRLVVIVPVFVAVAGIILLASKLAGRFRAIEEPPGRDSPPVPSRDHGPAGQPLKWVGGVAGVPASSAQTNSSSNGVTGVTSADPTRSKPSLLKAASAVASLPVAPSPAQPRPGDVLVSGIASSAAPSPQGIVGTVLLRRNPPPEQEIPMDPACGALHPGRKQRTRLYVVGTNGGLPDVFVVLRKISPLQGELLVAPVEIRQRACEYLP